MLLRNVDSFTPLDRIPVERSQVFIVPFEMTIINNCSVIYN
jgi:hypothetical protein